jgi:two-component system response regulator FixJ
MVDRIHVALIDDDEAVLDSLRLYFEQSGVGTSCFASGDEFLQASDRFGQFDCVVADVRMPGISGTDLVRRISPDVLPIILITGHGDIDMAVSAIKRGAFDFIEKPFDERRLLESIKDAVSHGRQRLHDIAALANVRARFESLTDRQREVMAWAALGLSNKEIGRRLGISDRTVEIHRAWMMEKMGARNLAELVRMHMQLEGSS